MSHAELFEANPVADLRRTPREFVETYQRDLLRLAFTLTGNEAVSLYLARDVFHTVMTSTGSDELETGAWAALVTELGESYMTGADPEGSSDRPSDDEAARLRVAIELLSRPMRTALVLRDLGGLGASEVASICDFAPVELDAAVTWSRERLVEASDRYGEPPQRLLASLATGAPRVDLWPDLAPGIEEHKRRKQRRDRRIVVTIIAVLMAAAIWASIWLLGGIPFWNDNAATEEATLLELTPAASTIAPSPMPTASPTSAPTAAAVQVLGTRLVNDPLLQVRLLDETEGSSGDWRWFSYAADDDAFTRLATSAVEIRHISPDGRWIALVGWRSPSGEQQDIEARPGFSAPVLSVAHDGVPQGWEHELPYGDYPVSWECVIAGNYLYLISNAPEPATLTAFDLETGEIVATRTIEVPRLGAELRAGWTPLPEGDWRIDVALFFAPTSPDAEIYASVTLSQFGFDIRNRVTTWYYRIDPVSLLPSYLHSDRTVAGSTSGADDVAIPDFPVWEARMMPNASGLYDVKWAGQQITFTFLDLVRGERESLTTDFTFVPPTEDNGVFHTVINSNDGRKLYVYSSLSGEVAIVDLTARRLERTFPLDLHGLRDVPIDVQRADLSPDGERLYLTEHVVAPWNSDRSSLPPESSPLWVVDVATWQVVQRINVPGSIGSLLISADSGQFHALSQVRNPGNPDRRRYVLTTYDTETYEQVNVADLSELVDQNVSIGMVSFADLYRTFYNRAPIVDGIEPGSVENFATLPRVRVRTPDKSIPVGITVPVALEFLDPATGEPFDEEQPEIRFDPDQLVTLAFEQPGAKSVVSIAADLEPGQISGSIKLKAAGPWSARIIIGDGTGGFTLILKDVFYAIPTFEGSDGRLYTLRLSAVNEPLVPGQETPVTASFVDGETGEPLPAEVSLIDGLPEDLRISYVGPGSFISDLPATGHGVYTGSVTAEATGRGNIRIILRQPESGQTSAFLIEMGMLVVISP